MAAADDDSALVVGERVSDASAAAAVELITGGVGEDFEEGVEGGM